MNMETLTIEKPDGIKWKHERDIPNAVWNRYMKKFGKKYRLAKNGINIWYICCKFGTIQLYSLSKHQLCFIGVFRSKRHLTWFKKTLKRLTVKATIMQENDVGIMIMFDESKLDAVSNTLRIYRKYKISDERRKVLAKRMAKVREMKQ